MERYSIFDVATDCIMVVYGEKVVVNPLNKSNAESYLSIYKRASAFTKAYEMMPDFGKIDVNVLKIMFLEKRQIKQDT